MQKTYYKLVRDRIPEIVQDDGYTCETEVMAEEEYRKALREKLVEEALEAAVAEGHDLVTELADLYEVIDALMSTYGTSRAEVQTQQEQRRQQRGGFAERIRLLHITSNEA